jgi:hypothetical protein
MPSRAVTFDAHAQRCQELATVCTDPNVRRLFADLAAQ